MKYLVLLFFLFLSPTLLAQEDSIPPQGIRDSLVKKKAPKKPLPISGKTDSTRTVSIKDYKIISFARDTTFLDTTLTILKEYKYNYLRTDDFELMQFANVGQPYNKLGVNFERRTLYPNIGAKAKHANYAEIEDVNYYNVATPMTELMFKTTFEQGQLLDALLTFNTSKRLNFSLAYKGFRSLGKYQNSQAQSGNFKVTTNYETANKQYSLRAHIAAQDIETQENGGLSSKELQFESGDPEFTDRTRVDVVFTDANNKVLGKRYFLEHDYRLLGKGTDSLNKETTSLTIGHQFNYETKYYQYSQTAQNAYFGEAFLGTIDDKASLKTTYNQFQTKFYNPLLGRLTGFVALYNYNYFFNSLLVSDDGQIQSQLKGEEISLGAQYEKRIGKFAVKGNAAYTLVGELTGTMLDAAAGYDINKDNKVLFSVHTRSSMPDFNFLLYQSDYENYNWQNTSRFDKQNTVGVEFLYEGKRLGTLSAKYTTLNNYTYFTSEATPEQVTEGVENAFIKPFQEGDAVGYLKVRYNKEFRVGMFALNNTVLYQNVSQTNNVLNVPQLVTRNTLYFSSDVFKKAMYLQTGITLKYFTEYTMDSYNPVLGEFYVQENEKLGGFPMLDFFINARVKQTRIFLKAEHFNSSFSGYNFYSAPNYPYRDFVIRFGLVWNFFS
jgi:hypothetical protein